MSHSQSFYDFMYAQHIPMRVYYEIIRAQKDVGIDAPYVEFGELYFLWPSGVGIAPLHVSKDYFKINWEQLEEDILYA